VIFSTAPNPVPFTVTGVVGGPNVDESVMAGLEACAAPLTETSKASPRAKTTRSESAIFLLMRVEKVMNNLTFKYVASLEDIGFKCCDIVLLLTEEAYG